MKSTTGIALVAGISNGCVFLLLSVYVPLIFEQADRIERNATRFTKQFDKRADGFWIDLGEITKKFKLPKGPLPTPKVKRQFSPLGGDLVVEAPTFAGAWNSFIPPSRGVLPNHGLVSPPIPPPLPTCPRLTSQLCPTGLVGENGLPGEDGYPGVIGDRGKHGIHGDDLDAGLFHCTGRVCSAPPGKPGPIGLPGIPGRRGINGLPGGYIQLGGAPGLPGEVGLPGLSGLPGPPGIPGNDGFLSTVKGQKGLRGETGEQGFPGLDGDEGLPLGIGGLVGLIGLPGLPGSNGLNGPDGDFGLPGIDGSPGNDAGYCSCEPPNYGAHGFPPLDAPVHSFAAPPINNPFSPVGFPPPSAGSTKKRLQTRAFGEPIGKNVVWLID